MGLWVSLSKDTLVKLITDNNCHAIDGYEFYTFCHVEGTSYEIKYLDGGFADFRKDKKVGKAIVKFLDKIYNDLISLNKEYMQ